MASYELTGKLKTVLEVQSFSSGFTKREFVVTTEEQYPQDIKFELYKEKTSAIDKFKEGDLLNVSFNVRGSEYNGKYFVNLNAWKIDVAQAGGGSDIPPALDPMRAMPAASSGPAVTSIDDIGEDDLPF